MEDFDSGIVGIRIISTTSTAKCISILRKYNSLSIAELVNAINNDEFVFSTPFLDTSGLRQIRKCYKELVKAKIDCNIYEKYHAYGKDYDELMSLEVLSNTIGSHRITELETIAEMNAETDDSN